MSNTLLRELPILLCHLAPLGFALARPLALVPLPSPRPAPPRPAPAAPTLPRLLSPDGGLEAGAGVANLDVDREDGGFSTNDVSVVLRSHHELIDVYDIY